jgi:hypothetical protein
VTVFDTAHTYDVTAGVGPFNGSYVQPFFDYLVKLSPGYPFKVMPYSYSNLVNDLVTNPLYSTTTSPIQCTSAGDRSTDCASFLFSGGVVGTTPWIPTGFPDHPLVQIEGVSVMQLEFQGTHGSRTHFSDLECQVFGSNKTLIAAEFCLSQPKTEILDAGMS